jgi:DNA-binding CsgD family transcriptional regulator
MGVGHPVILERERELAALSAVAAAGAAGHGGLVLVEGPAGIGKTTLLRAACDRCDGQRVLTARGLALERGFPYGIVRQLLDPVRGEAGPLDGAAGLAARVFDWTEAGPVEDDVPYATMHGLYWLVASLAAARPLVLAVDDLHWADAPSLRWLAHLAARLDGLPAALLLAVRDGPDAPPLLDELRASPGVTRLGLGPLGPGAVAELVRRRLGGRADEDLCRECHASTGGNPFLLETLAAALSDQARSDEARSDDASAMPGLAVERAAGSPVGSASDPGAGRASDPGAGRASDPGAGRASDPGAGRASDPGAGRVLNPVAQAAPGLVARAALGPVAEAVLRRVTQLGDGAGPLTRALAVLGGPAPLRHAAALAGQDLALAARLTDRLRAADVLAPGSLLEFAHPIVRAAVYESIPPGERALAHAEAAALLERDGAGPERLALHLMRSEPAGDPRVAGLLRAAATAASGRGAPATAAEYLRRALDEPPDLAARPGLELDLGIALARERNPEAVTALREAVRLAGTPAERAHAALLAARVLGIWGYHDSVITICQDALARDVDPEIADSLEVELFQNRFSNGETAGQALAQVRNRPLGRQPGQDPGSSAAWRINGALAATVTGQPAGDLVLEGVAPDSLTAVFALLVMIWNDDLGRAGGICDAVLADARRRGSMSMVAHASCLRSMIMRRLGQLEEAADDARVALEFKLATSPPLATAWAAAFRIDALTALGRLNEAEAVAIVTAGREPPEGWIHTVMFRQSRGALRLAQHRPAEALEDLLAAAEGWRALGVENPAVATWRSAAAAAYRALGQQAKAAALVHDQLELVRRQLSPAREQPAPTRAPIVPAALGGSLVTLGLALRAHGVTCGAPDELAEAVRVLEPTPARYDLALALADYGASLRHSGQRTQAREPLLRALDLAERTGAAALAAEVRQELLAVGARPRRPALTGPDALTSAERRVAALAADGLSNRQIAEHLFVTQATVETHLRHAFRKLGITTRASLPSELRR